ncbi:MAG TPA: hypothetical protein VF669_18815 [Tepidisphaeraceae bacterium]|jgi:hypothetical protein
MTILALLLLVLGAVALVLARFTRMSTGWMMLTFAALLFGHAAMTRLLALNNGGVDPDYEWADSRWMFVTLPAGLVLLVVGSATLGIKACLARRRAKP